MNLLPAQSQCRKCSLGEGCKNAGLPSRTLPELLSPPRRQRALLVIGEAPGYNEDIQGKTWVGWAGKLLERWLLESKPFDKQVDIFLTNAIRCHPPQNENPSAGQMKACREHLLYDIKELYRVYKGNLTVLCAGSFAAKTAGYSSLTQAFRSQGQQVSFSDDSDLSVPVFFTNHPAALRAGRQPTMVRAISLHLHLLYDVLTGVRKVSPPSPDVPPRALLPPKHMPSIISLDIETYGILEGSSQTVFNPTQSHIIDHIRREDMVVTTALAWRPEPDAPIENSVYVWDARRDRSCLYSWIRRATEQKRTLIGKNLVFDLSYLRYCDDLLHYYIQPHKGLQLDDAGIINHLDFEQRPERSLKNISALFGLADYAESAVTGAKGNATTLYDPELWKYNALDAIVTLELYELLWKRIKERYGPKSAKLSPTCTLTRNELIWTLLHMTEVGVALDPFKIKKAHLDHTKKADRILAWTKYKHDLPLAGTGSMKAVRKIIVDSLDTDLINDPLVALTPKTKEVSTKKDNINLILFRRPIGDPRRSLPRLLTTYRHHAKIVQSYTTKLLTNPVEGLINPMFYPLAFPRWYGIPQHISKNETDKTGGTIQGRITCRGPALMTFPPSLKTCYASRFQDGWLRDYDLSQIELRVGALLSGDPVMLREYRNDEDRHAIAALTCWPHLNGKEPDFKDHWRQAAKQLNFLMLYRGGARKFQETLRTEHGIEMDISLCKQAIFAFNERYPAFRKWQDGLIEQACRSGYLEVPTGWSRSFSGGRAAIMGTYVNEICNFPVQCLAAQIMLSAQAAILYDFSERHLLAVIPTQTYDHLKVDCPPEENKKVHTICSKHLTNPPLMARLEQVYERTVPIKYEGKEQQCHGPSLVNSLWK